MPQSSNLKEIAKALNLPIESFGDKEAISQLSLLQKSILQEALEGFKD